MALVNDTILMCFLQCNLGYRGVAHVSVSGIDKVANPSDPEHWSLFSLRTPAVEDLGMSTDTHVNARTGKSHTSSGYYAVS